MSRCGFRMKKSSPKGFAYFDSNVISSIVRKELSNPIELLRSSGIEPVASEIVLHEVNQGSPNGERDFIDNQGFLFVSAHEAMYLDGQRTFYTVPVGEEDLSLSDPIDDFLRKLARSFSGSKSAGDLTEVLRSNVGILLDSLEEELETDDLRILSSWSNGQAQLKSALAELPSVPSPLLSQSDLKLMDQLMKELGNIKPPSVVDKIAGLPLLEGADFLREKMKPFVEDENIKARLQDLCLTLVSIGFARDRRLPKDDEGKSEAGARSQFNDFYHISAAATCDCFITADSRCARLAYAVFEVFGFRTEICLAVPHATSRQFVCLGPDFWP